jgi:hypothetical protein
LVAIRDQQRVALRQPQSATAELSQTPIWNVIAHEVEKTRLEDARFLLPIKECKKTLDFS